MTTDKAKNIAALKRQLKSTTNATLKNALTKKIERLKQELEVSKTPAKEIAMQVRKATDDVNAMSKSDFNALIKKLAMKPEYSFLKGMTKQEIKDDLSREAKPVGWRFRGRTNFKKPTKSDIKSGNNVYYEGRPNRSDVIRPAKLAEGGNLKPIPAGNKGLPKLPKEVRNRMGYMAEGGAIKNQYKGKSYNEIWDNWTNKQRQHFIEDHLVEFMDVANTWSGSDAFVPEIITYKSKDLPYRVYNSLVSHIKSGQYGNGGGVGKKITTKVYVNNPYTTVDIFDYEFNSNNLDKIKKEIKALRKEVKSEDKEYDITGEFGLNGEQYSFYGSEVDKMANGGGVNDYTQSLGMVKVKFSDPKYNYETNVSGSLTEKDVRDYFVGKSFNVASYPNEIFEKVVDVEFFPKGTYAEGGMMNANEENREMVMNNNVQIAHHAEELKKAVKSAKHVPAWVVAKVYEATTALSNVTHYLDGTNKMATGGGVGEMHRSEESGMMARGGMAFSESALKEGLGDVLTHLYKAQNELDGVMSYLDRTGQGGLKSALKKKFHLESLDTTTEKLDNYLEK